MEKRWPTDDLDAVTQVLGSARTRAILTLALRDATALGFDRHGGAVTVQGLERTMSVTSVTTFADT